MPTEPIFDLSNKAVLTDFLSKVATYGRCQMTRKQVAESLGISYETYYAYAKEYPQIVQVYKQSKAKVIGTIAGDYISKALGSDAVVDSGTGEITKEAVEPNMRAQEFVLNRKGGWNEDIDHNINLSESFSDHLKQQLSDRQQSDE